MKYEIKRLLSILLEVVSLATAIIVGMLVSILMDIGLTFLEDGDASGFWYVAAGIFLGFLVYKICKAYIKMRNKEQQRGSTYNGRYKHEVIQKWGSTDKDRQKE